MSPDREKEVRLFDKVFNGDDGDYAFTASHIAISGVGLPFGYDTETHEWWMKQTASHSGAKTWEVRDSSHIGVVLKMIALRLGLKATFEEIEENDED